MSLIKSNKISKTRIKAYILVFTMLSICRSGSRSHCPYTSQIISLLDLFCQIISLLDLFCKVKREENQLKIQREFPLLAL